MDGRSPRSLRWLGALLVIYLGFPLAAFAVRAATGSDEGWNAPGLWSALLVSVVSATASLCIGVLTGVPLAYVLARRDGWLSRVVGVLVQLPLAVPPLITGIILIYIVGPYSFLGRLSGQRLTETIWGLIIAQSFVSIPFLVVVARSAFRAVDPSLREVAATLGHGPLARFLRIDVPAASDGIRTGMILMWLRAFGEYGTVVVLAYHPYSLPVYVDNLFSSAPLAQADAPTVLAFAVAALAIALSAVRRVPGSRRRQPHAATAPAPTTPTAVGFDIDVAAGTFRLRIAHPQSSSHLAIVGPSGSGKSLTLRTLAGLLGPGAGDVRYGGADVTDIPPERRRLGYVPQGLGLIPGRNVWQQVMLGTQADAGRAAWWLETLGLGALTDRYPEQLSGGQQQRVSLARALAPGPEVVLLDEPFSALDAPVRQELRRELRLLQRRDGLSTVLVTHDPEEAALLADEILVLAGGLVLQSGSIGEVYRRPGSLQVARLLGLRNVGEGVIGTDGESMLAGSAVFATAQRLAPGTQVLWSVQPELVRIGRSETTLHPSPTDSTGTSSHRATVHDVIDLGTTVEVVVALDGGVELTSRSTDTAVTRAGDSCVVQLEPETINVWPVSTTNQAAPIAAADTPGTG
jgi:ABC-type Fe3+/spermidine/putrescine transport system ATPase subunit/ABC-type sulfate transport system permease component